MLEALFEGLVLVLQWKALAFMMLGIVGLAFIASLSSQGGRGMLRGFLAGALGLFLATIGQDPQAGVARYALGTLYLWQGLDLVPVLVGLFAIPEIIDLVVRGTSIAGERQPANLQAGVVEGIKDTCRDFWMVVRVSAIGVFVRIMRGVGGGVPLRVAHSSA